MRFNDNNLKNLSRCGSISIEGKLKYKYGKDGSSHDWWFRLCNNLLFYFRTTSTGRINEKEVIGVIFIEHCYIEMGSIDDGLFSFSISLIGEEKAHYFNVASLKQCEQWVNKLQNASFSALKVQFVMLCNEIEAITGNRPKMDVSIKTSANQSVIQKPEATNKAPPLPIRKAPPRPESDIKKALPPHVPARPISSNNLMSNDHTTVIQRSTQERPIPAPRSIANVSNTVKYDSSTALLSKPPMPSINNNDVSTLKTDKNIKPRVLPKPFSSPILVSVPPPVKPRTFSHLQDCTLKTLLTPPVPQSTSNTESQFTDSSYDQEPSSPQLISWDDVPPVNPSTTIRESKDLLTGNSAKLTSDWETFD